MPLDDEHVPIDGEQGHEADCKDFFGDENHDKWEEFFDEGNQEKTQIEVDAPKKQTQPEDK